MEQHGFFLKEVKQSFPYPPFPVAVMLIIEKAIIYAWEKLKESPPDNFNLSNAKEDNITAELQEKLEYLRKTEDVQGFNAKTFETVNRGSDFKNYNGTSIKKQPDLIIKLIGIRDGIFSSLKDGIFIECKPVDKKHSIKSQYCEEGIKRFIKGDYAWAMPDAMMLGYIKGNYSIIPKFYDILNKNKKKYNTKKLPYLREKTDKIYITKHKRDWNYPETGEPAKDISIRHLWLIISKSVN
jgi:hypothetical protein